jgi:hypothetical protein
MQLDPELIPIADRVLNFLKISRERGQITPENPISSTGIVEAAAKYNVIIKREDIYCIVHHLRHEGFPIASFQKGYCYAKSPEDFDSMTAENKSAIQERLETLKDVEKIKENMLKSRNSLFASPVGQLLNEKLGLEAFENR